MIRVLAIDDEPLALLHLQKLIERIPYFSLVAACSDAYEAMKVMEQEAVDAIFTDINMPDISGLEFTRMLSDTTIIVFTTAYMQYAIDGYKVSAIDYLLKPFGLPEFTQAAMKVKKQYELLHKGSVGNNNDDDSGNNTSASLKDEILFVKVDYRIVRINVSDIIYIESQSEYLKIHLKDRPSLMVLMSIKRIAELLPQDKFVRIHRSYVVNMNRVKEIARMRITMESDISLSIGDSYKDDVQKYINERLMGKE